MKGNLKLVLLSALLMSLAYPPLPLGFLAYFCLVPLVFALENKTPREAFRTGYLFGLISNILLLYWIAWPLFLGYYVLLFAASAAFLVLSLYPAILSFLYALIQRRWKTVAVLVLRFLWVSMEYLKSLGEIAFPWKGMKWLAGTRSLPPKEGDKWKIFFGRFQLLKTGGVELEPSPGWSWNRHGVYDTHIPECFTSVQFTTRSIDLGAATAETGR